MNVDKDVAMKLWKDVFGDKKYALDCFGTWMCRDAYSNEAVSMKDHLGGPKNYDYSWNVDHIRPKADFENENDANDWNNFEPMHRQNNLAKRDDCPHFVVKGEQYRIVKDDAGGYGIINSNGVRVDWKKDGRHYR
ncbi:MAG: hypothetical protein IK034_01790 [Bacilli bacterium]|nr:hypothetical protein [Bacilli bacterium]